MKFEPEPFDPTVPVWEQQPKETRVAYEAWLYYYRLGPDRTVYQLHKDKIASNARCHEWSVRWDWNRRVLEYDRHLDRKARADAEEEILAMRKRHANLGLAMQGIVSLELKKLAKLVRDLPNKRTLKANDLARLIELGTKLERISRGEPDQIREDRTTEAPPTKGLSDTVVQDIKSKILGLDS